VSECDAVLCLVGEVFGAVPADEGDLPRSYTQCEYDVARELGKPVFIFLTGDRFQPDRPPSDGPHERSLQRRHREALMAAHKCDPFDSVEQLRERVALALPRIRDAVGRAAAETGIFYLHPPKSPCYFAGRVEVQRQLVKDLRRKTPSIVAVIGMGGQGKTSLVYQVLRNNSRLPFAGGFWCTAYRESFSFDAFLDEALQCFLDGRFDKRELPEVTARAARVLGVMQRRPVLIVIDAIERWLRGWGPGQADSQGAETVEQRLGAYEGLDDFLQMASSLTSGSHLVRTSRALPAALDRAEHALVPVRRPEDADISLQGLDPDSSVVLLRSLGVDGDESSLKDVAQTYANHPLALEILGCLLAKKYGGQLVKISDVTPMDHHEALFKLFEEARASLPGRREAERFLVLIAHCLENPSLEMLAALLLDEHGRTVRPSELLEQVVTLADWSLVGWDGRTETVSLRPLLKQYFTALIPPDESREIHRRLADWYGSQPVEESAATLEQAKPLVLAIEHALRAGDPTRYLECFFRPVTPLCSFVEWLGAFGHLATGLDLLGKAAGVCTGLPRVQLLIPRSAMNRLLSNFRLSLDDLDEAVAVLESPTPPPAPESRALLAGALSNRGSVYRQLAHYDIAREDFDRAVVLLESSLDRDGGQLQLAAVLMNRARAIACLGHPRESLADSEEAVKIFRRLTENSREIGGLLAHALLSGAILRHQAGDRTGAKRYRQEGKEVGKRVLDQGETEFLSVFLRDSIAWAVSLAPEEPSEAAMVLRGSMLAAEQALSMPEPSESLEAELRQRRPEIRGLLPMLERQGVDLLSLQNLRKLMV
jgi:tetratricopeptide (TPR) repeat protein